MGTLHEDQYTLLIISHSVLLRMRNVSDKTGRGNQNTHFVLSNFFFENCAVYEIMWKNIVELGRSQMTVWLMRIACWISKATHMLIIYPIIIHIAFPLHQWLQECALMLRLCKHCLSCITDLLNILFCDMGCTT